MKYEGRTRSRITFLDLPTCKRVLRVVTQNSNTFNPRSIPGSTVPTNYMSVNVQEHEPSLQLDNIQ